MKKVWDINIYQVVLNKTNYFICQDKINLYILRNHIHWNYMVIPYDKYIGIF